jgi:hypothetical protein
MYLFLGVIGLVLYALIFFVFGISALRRGHWLLFVIGFVVPLLWIIGAVLSPTGDRGASAAT